MWNDIKEFIRIAVKNRYQLKISANEFTVTIEYDYQDESLSGKSLEWLDEDEYIGKYREEPEE